MSLAQKQVLIACMLVTFAFGSIHSFSVFLTPLELSLDLPRATLSLIYSFSLIALTVMVLFGYRVYALVPPNFMILITAMGAALGLFWAANASSWLELVVSYSAIYGATNGVAYGYSLQLVGRALPNDKKAFGMALVTATYAVGSVVFSFGLGYIINHFSVSHAMQGLGLSVFALGVIASILLKLSQIQYLQRSTQTDLRAPDNPVVSSKIVALLWCAYCAAVFAGLMAIGHATGIIQSMGGDYRLGVWGAVFIGIGSAIGGILTGLILSDKNIHWFLIGLPLVSALFLIALVFTQAPLWALSLLNFVGLAYGALIAVYPFAIAEYFGQALAPKVYGQVFTAWGFAGLAGPWLAGKLYDLTGQYQFALAVAGFIAIISMAVFSLFLRHKPFH